MAYLTQAYLEASLGTTKVAKLCPGTTGPDLATLIAQATAEVRSALSIGGYTGAIPETVYASNSANCPDEIRLAALGSFLELAYGANDLELPEAYRAYVLKVEELKAGKLEIANVTRNVARAVGGVSFTDSTSTVANGGRPAMFRREDMEDF